MFKTSVTSASQGDRIGICVTQFDPKLLERGIACQLGLARFIHCGIVPLKTIKYFQHPINSKSKLHITIGHETVMASITCFKSSVEKGFDFNTDYLYLESLGVDHDGGRIFALLEFEKPVLAVENSLIIASKLDIDIHSRECRIAFHGKLLDASPDKEYKATYLPKLRVYKNKTKSGTVLRIADANTVIVKDLFKKETCMEDFLGLDVRLSSGQIGKIESSFGQTGKVKVSFKDGLGELPRPTYVELTYRRYFYGIGKRIFQ